MNKSQPTFNFFFWQGFEKTYQKLSKQEDFCQSNKLVFVFYHKLQFSAIWELAILDKAKNLPQVCKTFTYNTKQILSVAASTQVCFHVYEISLFVDSVELTLRWAMTYFLPLNSSFPPIKYRVEYSCKNMLKWWISRCYK